MIRAATISDWRAQCKPWADRAAELAVWAEQRAVNRRDVWGGYVPKKFRGEGSNGATTKPSINKRGSITLSTSVIEKHFYCGSEGDVIGVHAISQENTSLWGAIDLDRHDDEPGQPPAEQLQSFALAIYAEMVGLGFRPLLTDSNGKGGLHLRVFFREAVASGALYRWLQTLVAKYADFGFATAPETFPKQEDLEHVTFGNWMRLPGRHHSKKHLTRAWDGAAWFDGAAAVAAILAITGDDPALMPFIAPPQRPSHDANGYSSHNGKLADIQYRAARYLDTIPGAVSGQRGHDATYRVACKLVQGFDLPTQQALVPFDEWNQRCQPPWEREDLLKKLNDAANEPGRHGYLLDAGGSRRGKDDRTGSGEDERPEIIVTAEEHEVNDAAIAALASDRSLYQRGGALVQVVRQPKASKERGIRRPINAPRILPVESAGLRERLSRHAEFYMLRETKEGMEKKRQHPPAFCSPAILARGRWEEIRDLAGVVTSPVLRPDGSILSQPGFDEATGLLFEPDCDVPTIAENPTKADVAKAVITLLDIVQDFPFANDSHTATWLASVLTPLAQFAFDGPAPLFLIDSNVRGAGKSLLCDVASVIATGLEAPRTAASTVDAEMRKLITAAAIGGDRLILLDNVAGELGGPSLDAALTANRWKDRILGESVNIELPLQVVWFATGNNVILVGDACRRVAHVRLHCREENPEERAGFAHPDLKRFVADHRPDLLAAALTVLRGYCAAGRPRMKVTPWGSFEGWSALVREAVVWAGLDDPGEGRQELSKRSDREAAALRQLIAGLVELKPGTAGVTVGEMLDAITLDLHGACRCPKLREAILELCPAEHGKLPSTRSIGKKLARYRDRVIDGVAIEQLEYQGSSKWTLAAAT